jgi:uroporphyrinogen decarboxylase
MNSRDLIIAAIKGVPHPRIPVAQHNFPFCIRHYGITMSQFRSDPILAARALAYTCFDFGYDCIIMDIDTCTLAEAMGSICEFPEHEPARVKKHFLTSLKDLEGLVIPDPYKNGRLPLWLATTRELRRLVGNEIAIMGRADQGPFGLLFQLRSPDELMMELLTEPEEYIFKVLDICTRAGVIFAKAQLASGADLTSIGDSASGESLISPDMYYRFAQPFQAKYKEQLGNSILSLHICGKTNNIIGGMVNSGCEVLELDHLNDIEKSLEIVNNRSSIWGNIDPSSVISQGSEDKVLEECRKVLEVAVKKTSKFVLCPGCVVNSDAPAENIAAMTKAAKEWGHYS